MRTVEIARAFRSTVRRDCSGAGAELPTISWKFVLLADLFLEVDVLGSSLFYEALASTRAALRSPS
jgi:hypothetical protein